MGLNDPEIGTQLWGPSTMPFSCVRVSSSLIFTEMHPISSKTKATMFGTEYKKKGDPLLEIHTEEQIAPPHSLEARTKFKC